MQNYVDLGLDLIKADNSVEAGIHATLQRLSAGRLKVFATLTNWFSEFRLYRRDEKGRVVKENDHLMDCTRYLVMSGVQVADTPQMDDEPDFDDGARNSVGGY